MSRDHQPGLPHLLATAALIFLLSLLGCDADARPATPQTIRDIFLAHENGHTDPKLVGLLSPDETKRFYQNRHYQPAWPADPHDVTFAELVSAINHMGRHGLDSDIYAVRDLTEALAKNDLARAEILSTDRFLTLSRHLHRGLIDPKSMDPLWGIEVVHFDGAASLERALTTRRVAQTLEDLAPSGTGYIALQAALERLQDSARKPADRIIPPGALLRKGDRGPRVLALRQRLLGEPEPSPDQGNDLFDETLVATVKSFQSDAALTIDGIVGPATLKELNKTTADRIDQVKANMERWRWLTDIKEARLVRINIPSFRLEAVANGRVERAHAVIVGKPSRPTPIFSSRIAQIILNPWWEVPARIARLDKLPQFQSNPASVEQFGYQILDSQGALVPPQSIDWQTYSAATFPFRLRQKPGPHNALGRVKFWFPNPYAVFIHDTPNKALFAQNQRAFSSGCIRVEHALELTRWALSESQSWRDADLADAVASGETQLTDLSRPIGILVVYFTAVMTPDGAVRFLNDVYDRDQPLIDKIKSYRP